MGWLTYNMYTCISFYFHTFELSFMVPLDTFSQRISVINRLTLFNCLRMAIFNKSVSNYATNYLYRADAESPGGMLACSASVSNKNACFYLFTLAERAPFVYFPAGTPFFPPFLFSAQ